MCGIAGYLSDINRDNSAAIAKMLDAIAHRGPDERSEYHFKNYHVGMSRLAINDPTEGSQPLYNESRDVVIMYNGEIYNSPKLRIVLENKGYRFRTNSDGEVICHLYDEYGEELFSYLDGMFAIALWDKSRRKLLLARDQVGEKPLYYSKLDSGRGVVFASEINALRSFQGLNLSLNRQAIWDLPTFLWIPEPSTVYQEVKAIPPGHVVKADENGISLSKYKIQFDVSTADALEDGEIIAETRRVVDEAVRSRLLSDVPVGSFLSGGLDSSIVATLATKYLGPIDTFSVAFEKVSDPYHGSSDESEDAASYAKQLGSRHHTIRVTADSFRESLDRFCHHGGQPFAVSSGLGILAVAQAANESGVKVLLSGDCADECFGGYSWYVHLALKKISLGQDVVTYGEENVSYQNFGLSQEERLRKLAGYSAQQRAWAWHYYANENEKKALFSADWREGQKSSLRHFAEFDAAPEWDPLQFIAQDRSFYLPNEMLNKLDRMTMAHSVEGRVPFAAPKVLAHAQRLNYSQMVRGNTLKWALRQAYAEILPGDIIQRPKHGFNVPIDHWLKNEWRDLLGETFASGSALHRHGLLESNAATISEQLLHDTERLNGHSCFVL